MSSVVVQNEMNVQARVNGLLDAVEESEKLLMPMPRLALADDRALQNVPGGKQRCGPVPLVIVDRPFRQAGP